MRSALAFLDRVRAVSPRAANLLLSTAVPQVIPSAAGLGLRVEELSDARARASLPLKRRTKNHVGSVYFGAQMTLMEITMGLVLFRHFPPGPFGMLVNRVEADFHAKAKGRVVAVCEPGESVSAISRALADSGRAEVWVTVRLLDAADERPITTARFLAAVRKFEK
ncbi:DUF4442 domain-containing protein [Aggregicoccus sp. 17bor-14]|uniref:PaaI family thioesterase n=1 Tax=Myxococcaceae TaxID=31 RepID=UPI00129C263D|nr:MULTISPECIES: PaaI family thioesterase [Myxococcaceae]MBF5043006.1 PaaI family thioesterase [Simulacricoccus sp. 17bor-14]MRI88771.1 DUF4442 domain-containing protein [Aggregicoccus sp. 17bor-14]